MHSFIVSVVSFFLSPYHWILILLLAAYIFRRKKLCRVLAGSAVLLFLIFSNSWLLHQFAHWFQPAPLVLKEGTRFSCGIVAGGFASPVQDGDGTFNGSADRFIQALRLYKQGHISHILVSGGNGKKEQESFREAAFAKKEFVIMGVPDSVILIEDNSTNTQENAINSSRILRQRQLQPPYLLISSAHHLPRAAMLYKQAGAPVVPYPTTYIAGRGIVTTGAWIPSLDTLFTWDVFLKEFVGVWWYS